MLGGAWLKVGTAARSKPTKVWQCASMTTACRELTEFLP